VALNLFGRLMPAHEDFTKLFCEQTGHIVRAAEELRPPITRDYKTIFALCEKVGEIEGRADESFDRGLMNLRAEVAQGAVDTLGYIDRKELYELIEHVVDKCDDVANALQRITAKHV
jgi:uncharacterized protein Yka (UPF0111/DUF47 family)